MTWKQRWIFLTDEVIRSSPKTSKITLAHTDTVLLLCALETLFLPMEEPTNYWNEGCMYKHV